MSLSESRADQPVNRHADQWVTQLEIIDKLVTIRPIKHGDIKLEEEFVNGLSAEARRNRFSGGISGLSADTLIDLCHVDYHDSMAFIATIEGDDATLEVGVARYSKTDNTNVHEMAIAVANDFQGSTLAAGLMDSLLEYARQHGVSVIKAVERYNNQEMKTLARDLGMTPTPDPDDPHQVIYTLSLRSTTDSPCN